MLLVSECDLVAFDTDLGWMAVGFQDDQLARLTFGQPSKKAALTAVGRGRLVTPSGWRQEIVGRLEAYAAGESDDFLDVELVESPRTAFQAAVVRSCRRIPYGETRSYAELAAEAGSPLAARAVGNIMARNCVPLIVPCHRVVGAGGALGGYSAPEGLDMKRRLLALEKSG